MCGDWWRSGAVSNGGEAVRGDALVREGKAGSACCGAHGVGFAVAKGGRTRCSRVEVWAFEVGG